MITEILRIILGAIVVLFIPGYAMTFALFKEREIDKIERITLSFALSIALVPLVLFYLNQGLGIRINLINLIVIILFIVIFSLTVWAVRTNKLKINFKNYCKFCIKIYKKLKNN